MVRLEPARTDGQSSTKGVANFDKALAESDIGECTPVSTATGESQKQVY